MTAAFKRRVRRAGFTLVEMLLVIGIIALLAGFVLAAMAGARAAAQEQATRSLIARLNSRLMAKWDSYRFRRLPVDLNRVAWERGLATSYENAKTIRPEIKQALRMEVLWELQRFELPDKWVDIDPQSIPGVTGLTGAPTLPGGYKPLLMDSQGNTYVTGALANYQRIFKANVNRRGGLDLINDDYQGAECLYLIMTAGLGEDSLSPEELAGNAIGDKDGDGFMEFQDAWGEPLRFTRWPSGLVSDLQPMQVTAAGDQYRDPGLDPDPLDYTKVFQKSRATSGTPYQEPYYGFRLVPLIESSGPDREFARDTALHLVTVGNWWTPIQFQLRFGTAGLYEVYPIRCPYTDNAQPPGRPFTTSRGWEDNINNHQSGAK